MVNARIGDHAIVLRAMPIETFPLVPMAAIIVVGPAMLLMLLFGPSAIMIMAVIRLGKSRCADQRSGQRRCQGLISIAVPAWRLIFHAR